MNKLALCWLLLLTSGLAQNSGLPGFSTSTTVNTSGLPDYTGPTIAKTVGIAFSGVVAACGSTGTYPALGISNNLACGHATPYPAAPASPTSVNTCSTLSAATNYKLTANIGSSTTSVCLTLNAGTVLDYNGFTVTGQITLNDYAETYDSVGGGGVTCAYDVSTNSCVYSTFTSAAAINGVTKLHDFNCTNTAVSTSSARCIFLDYGSLVGGTIPVGQITAKIYNITALSATGASSTRIVNIQVQGIGTQGVPSNSGYPEFYNNKTTCQSLAAACQGIVAYGLYNVKIHNNKVVNQLSDVSLTETPRGTLCDQTAACEMYSNYYDAQDGRAIRFRGTTNTNDVNSAHDNYVDNVLLGSNSNHVAAFHLGDPDTPSPGTEEEDLTINHNVIAYTSGQVAMSRGATLITFQDNTVNTTGAANFYNIRFTASFASSADVRNNSVTGGGSLVSTGDTGATGSLCTSGTQSGSIWTLNNGVCGNPTVTADMGTRSGGTVIPAKFIGAGGMSTTLSNTTALATLAAAKINQTRLFVQIDTVCPAGTCGTYTALDAALTRAQTAGITPLIVFAGTPSNLGAGVCNVPSNPTTWGGYAAAVLHHIDTSFAGLVSDYEIRNEPDGLSNDWCPSPLTETQALSDYITLFNAAYSAMHAQATTDGVTIKVIGPVLASPGPHGTQWMSSAGNFLATVTAVDAISFHLYPQASCTTWNQQYTNMQGASTGFAHYYALVDGWVNTALPGKPIYVTEYNAGGGFVTDACRNTPTNGPLNNTLIISDFLNVIASNSSNTIPTKLNYFASTNGSGKFCLMGVADYNWDCSGASYVQYPAFYTYQLFAGTGFLDLQGGGHMVASITPGTTTSGLGATGFYTSTTANRDSVVIYNPTSVAYGTVTVQFQNPGITATTCNVYLVNAANSTINSSTCSLSLAAGTYSGTVAVPAYSTVAVSIQ